MKEKISQIDPAPIGYFNDNINNPQRNTIPTNAIINAFHVLSSNALNPKRTSLRFPLTMIQCFGKKKCINAHPINMVEPIVTKRAR